MVNINLQLLQKHHQSSTASSALGIAAEILPIFHRKIEANSPTQRVTPSFIPLKKAKPIT
jgi:hypothetical protein